MGVLYRIQRTTVISSLLYQPLYALLYIFSEISTSLYDFQRITTRYHQIFSKKKYINSFLKKLMLTRGNALQNSQLCNYFTEHVLEDFQ